MADKEQQFKQKVCCPICQSEQIQSKTAGFSVTKAAIGAVLIGPVGLVGGAIGANKIRLYCMKCGHEWSLAQQERNYKIEQILKRDRELQRTNPEQYKLEQEQRNFGAMIIVVIFLLGIIFFIVGACL